jgi:Holliday junction resolvasome RuvABC endonuclease subunit
MLQQNPPKSETYCVGIDASLTCTGIYCHPTKGDEWFGWSVQSIASDGLDAKRCADIAQDIIEALDTLNIVNITFEDYGPINKFAGKLTQRAEICGIIKHRALLTWKVPILMLSPPALKSFATGNGKASKPDMIKAAGKFGYYPETHDEADAFHASRLGLRIYRGDKTGVSFNRVNP